MPAIYIAGSRKFFDDIEKLAQVCAVHGVIVHTPKKGLGDSGFDGEKEALFRAFALIDECSVMYVFARRGYVGKTVAMEIAYAHARAKKIISSEEIEEFSARALVSEVVPPEELVGYFKKTSP